MPDEAELEAYWKDVRPPPPARVYAGSRDEDGSVIVTVTPRGKKRHVLSAAKSLRVFNHSPSGFEYGYGGSGPAQLALAILLDAYPEKGAQWAVRRHQAFKSKVIAALDRDVPWKLDSNDIAKAVEEISASLGGDTQDE